ncbi:MAG: helix-turn-helix domain-containing protein [Planctomycetaceae bacterium]|nr:helix-turn-helix domain-containing protein [Planctomycetaceae bacterium]
MKVSELAKRLSLSESKIYQLVEVGMFEHHRFGGAIRFSEEQIEAYLEETKQERQEQKPRPRQPHLPRLRHVRL